MCFFWYGVAHGKSSSFQTLEREEDITAQELEQVSPISLDIAIIVACI
jgi:hypothetical protein